MREFLELIGRIRTEPADPRSASRYARVFGAVCLAVAAWNLVFLFAVVPRFPVPVHFDTLEMRSALALMVCAGGAALWTSIALLHDVVFGTVLAKASLLCLLGSIAAFLVGMLAEPGFGFLPPGWFGVVFRIFMVLAFAQFLIPAFFAFGYLERLKSSSDPIQAGTLAAPKIPDPAGTDGPFREGPLPFGAPTTFVLSLAMVLVPTFLLESFLGMESGSFTFLPALAVVLLGPLAWNEIPSTFQKDRHILTRSRAGISMLFFQASAPFCTFLVYPDGVEVRVQLNRYFIPYDRLSTPPRVEGFLGRSLVLESRLPEVPRTLRIRTSKAAQLLEAMRRTMKA